MYYSSRSPLFNILVICLAICLFITVYQYVAKGNQEPFSFTELLTSLNSDSMPESLQEGLIPTDWLDWGEIDLGDWVIDAGLFVLDFNFLRDVLGTLIQVGNGLLFLIVGLINTIPFIAWVLGHVI